MEGIEKLSLIKVNDEGEKFFDFNALIPMPESLNMESGTIEEIAIEAAIRKLAKRRYDFQRPYATPAMTDKKILGKSFKLQRKSRRVNRTRVAIYNKQN